MKAQIVGKALVITSEIKTKEIARAQKICPEALSLIDEEIKMPLFSVGTVQKNGDIGKYGINFDTEGPGGKAQITLMLDKALNKEELADRFGMALINLTAVEAKFATEFTVAKANLDAAIANVEGVE